ncbi:MAG: hypothetical protein J7L56_05345, partial [Halomonas sp.]
NDAATKAYVDLRAPQDDLSNNVLDDLSDVSASSPTNGQVLTWNGSAWVPQNVPGDDWGSQVAQVSSPITGNGTSANPLGLSYGNGLTVSSGALVVNAGNGLGFSGSHLVNTGVTSITAGTGINVSAGTGDVTITNTGDTDASDDLTTSTSFSGDVSGTYDNLNINSGVVGNTEIADATQFVDIQDVSGTSQFTVTDGNRVLQFAGTGGASVSFDATNHRVTIDASGTSDGNNYVTGISFNTGTGVLTLTRLGLSSLTEDLDGRYAISSELSDNNNATTPVNWADLANVPAGFADGVDDVDDADADATNELQNLFNRVQDDGGANTYTASSHTDILRFNNGTNTTVNVSQSGNRVDISYSVTGLDNYGYWKLQANGGTTTNITSGATVNFEGSGATTVSRSGNTIIISSTDNVNDADHDPTNEAQTLAGSGSSSITLSSVGGTGGGTTTFSGSGATTVSRSGDTITIHTSFQSAPSSCDDLPTFNGMITWYEVHGGRDHANKYMCVSSAFPAAPWRAARDRCVSIGGRLCTENEYKDCYDDTGASSMRFWTNEVWPQHIPDEGYVDAIGICFDDSCYTVIYGYGWTSPPRFNYRCCVLRN